MCTQCTLMRGHSICTQALFTWASLVAQRVKNLPAMQEMQVQSLDWEDPLQREWQSTPVFLPGEFHGQRSLAGYIPWDAKSRTLLSNYILFTCALTTLDHAVLKVRDHMLVTSVSLNPSMVQSFNKCPLKSSGNPPSNLKGCRKHPM